MSDLKSRLMFGKRATPDAPPPLQATPAKNVKQRWYLVFGGLVGLVLLASTIFGDKPTARAPVAANKKDTGTVSVTPANADKAAYEARAGQDLATLRAEYDRRLQTLEGRLAREAELRAQAEKANVTPPPLQPTGNTGGLGALSAPPSPPVPKATGAVETLGSPVTAPPAAPSYSAPLPVPGVPRSSSPMSFTPPPVVGQASALSQAADTAAAKVRYRKNDTAGQLLAGSFASVALLTGLDAATSSAAQANPQPFLLTVTDHAQLPGAAKYRLKNCFILGTAYGDMSAERVYGRVSRLSCADKSNRLVLSQEVQGYLVDSDNKLGMRGAISDRQGAKLGAAMLAGFANGLTSALGSAQSTVLQNASTGELTSSISGSAALRASGLSGAQSATAQLADFYLKEAQTMFPVITVDAGRTGTIVFTAPVKLSWSDADSEYVQQVTPAQ